MVKPARVSYARNREDIILEDYFPDIKQGIYVDIGATHPIKASATKLFYQKGWHGIDVVAHMDSLSLIAFDRPKDTLLHFGVESAPNLKAMFDEQKPNHIHWMKINTEVCGNEVLQSNDWKKYHPEMVCITGIERSDESFLEKHGYIRVFSDGLNDYFLSKEALHRRDLAENVRKQAKVILSLQTSQELSLMAQQQELDSQRLQILDNEKVRAEKQSAWYEQAPLRWMLRKTARAIAGAIDSRMTAEPTRKVRYDAERTVSIAAKPTGADVQKLAATYRNTLQYQTTATPSSTKVLLFLPWIIYRVARKAMRLRNRKTEAQA